MFSDPFADDLDGGDEGHIHIRIQQRNGRKTLTTVQGLRSDYDLKKIVKACKKVSTLCIAYYQWNYLTYRYYYFILFTFIYLFINFSKGWMQKK